MFRARVVFLLSVSCLAVCGCASRAARTVAWSKNIGTVSPLNDITPPLDEQQAIELTQEQMSEPLSLDLPQKAPWLLDPMEAVQIAVERSKVLQDLGGSTLRNVNSFSTILEPAIQATDPRFGVEAALAAFDAQFNSRTFVNKNDRPVNNRLLIGSLDRLFQQDLITFQNEVTKQTAYGTEFFARKNTIYDANNADFNLFRSYWEANLEAGFRHPLGRGGGLDYNRIAGPGNTRNQGINGPAPGTYNGILIARINADSSVLDFEMGLRDLVSDVENAYWDLYFAYRNLEAKIQARDAALNTWRIEREYRDAQSGSGERESRAREQYYRFQAQVLESLTGREIDGTRTYNGSSGGTFRAIEGVHTAERRLRLLMNLPINDDRMIRPVHDPILVKILFDWHQIVGEAIRLRPELRKQDLQLKRGHLELIASKNSLLPQVDVLSQYRLRGLGKDLWGLNEEPFDNAVGNMMTGHFQEWQFGLEVNLPVGYRRAYNNVRNAQLKLARDLDLLEQKQRRVIHDVSNAYASVIRSFEIANVTLNQRVAAHEQLAVLRNLEENQSRVNTNEMLDAQNRASQADTGYYDAIVRYMIALKNVHFEKGTLLEYNNIAFVDRVRPARPVAVPQVVYDMQLTDYSVINAANRMAPPSEPVPAQPMPDPIPSPALMPSVNPSIAPDPGFIPNAGLAPDPIPAFSPAWGESLEQIPTLEAISGNESLPLINPPPP